jgi:hypothetical protein
MIKQTLKTISRVDKDIEQFVKDFNRMSYELGETAFKSIREPLLDELKFYPPTLPNQKYIRTYRLRRGWKAGIKRLNGVTFALIVSNDVEYARFVVGSLAQAESAAASFQAAIHQGRWPLASKTVGYWYDAFLEELDDAFAKELSQFGTIRKTRRAFTSRLR